VGSNLSYGFSSSMLVLMGSMDPSTSEGLHINIPLGPGNAASTGEDFQDRHSQRRIIPSLNDKRLFPRSNRTRDTANIPQNPASAPTTSIYSTRQQPHYRHRSASKNREYLVRLLEVAQDIVSVDHNITHAAVTPSFDTLSNTELVEALAKVLTRANLGFLLSIPTNTFPNATSTTNARSHVIVPLTTENHIHYRYPSIRLLENILGVRTYRKSTSSSHNKTKTKTKRDKRQKTFSHFLSHIPKSGTSYAFGLLCDLLWNQAEYFELPPSDRFRPCSVGTAQPYSFDSSSWRGHTKKHVCNLWMSEAGWTPLAKHNMIVLRNPLHHVLSQYFHCAESSEHGKRRRVKFQSNTNLTEWLTAWRDAQMMVVDRVESSTTGGTSTSSSNEKKNTMMHTNLARFECYNPTNLQSTYVFPRSKTKSTSRTNLTALHEYLYSEIKTPTKTNRDKDNDEDNDVNQSSSSSSLSVFQKTLYDDLQDRFVVVGDTSQMTVSVCLMFLHYTHWIPASCDCSTAATGTGTGNGTTTTSNGSAAGAVVRAFDPVKDSHGVQHHGSTYRATVEERQLIHELTVVDELLYEVGRQVLRDQIERAEHEFGIRLCRSL
jgi:hypothetical protein